MKNIFDQIEEKKEEILMLHKKIFETLALEGFLYETNLEQVFILHLLHGMKKPKVIDVKSKSAQILDDVDKILSEMTWAFNINENNFIIIHSEIRRAMKAFDHPLFRGDDYFTLYGELITKQLLHRIFYSKQENDENFDLEKEMNDFRRMHKGNDELISYEKMIDDLKWEGRIKNLYGKWSICAPKGF